MSNIKPTYISPVDGLPTPVDTSTDAISANAVYVQTSATPDTEVGISRDLSGNMVLLDQVNGPKTLAQLVVGSGGTVTSVGAAAPLSSSGGNAPSISLTGTVDVDNGGTGISTTPANGQLLVGNGTGYTLANLTAGANISITDGAGSIEIASTAAGGTEAGQKEPVVARYDFAGTPGPTLPTAPAAPTFTGTERFVGSGGGEFATLALAVAASSPGDIITVRAGYTTTETSLTSVVISKSLEIRGENRSTSGISGVAGSAGGNFLITIPAGINDVYIHDLTITNNVTAAQDPGGVSANIAATTMSQAYPLGSTGLRFERLNLIHWKFGISVMGAGWVINDCAFSCRLATAGTTIRHIGHYGQTGDCFITNCVITPTTDSTPRSQGIYMTTNFPGVGTYRPGQAGNLVIQNLSQSGSGNWNAYYLQDVMHEPGAATGSGFNSPATPGSFGLWFDGVSFMTPYSGNPCSVLEATGTIAPLSFFSTLYFNNCGGQGRTTGDNKGFFAVAGSTGTGRNVGTPTNGFYVLGTNTFLSSIPSATYAEASTVDNLLGVLTTNYAVPSPLLAPVVPVYVPSGTLTADGVALNLGDRVMLVSLSDGTYNGIYEVQAGTWTRALDMDAGANAAGYYWWVLGGPGIYARTAYVVGNAPGSDVVGTDVLGFVRTDFPNLSPVAPSNGQLLIGDGSGYQTANLTAGTGISVTNGAGSVTVANTGVISVGASSPLASSGGTTPSISLTGTVPVSNGGTGITTAPSLNQFLAGNGSNQYTLTTLAGSTGINVSGSPGAISVSNTGVTSLAAGTGISLSGSTGDITVSATGGGGTPAAPTNSIQFNNAGVFGGSSNLTYDGSKVTLTKVAPATDVLTVEDPGSGTVMKMDADAWAFTVQDPASPSKSTVAWNTVTSEGNANAGDLHRTSLLANSVQVENTVTGATANLVLTDTDVQLNTPSVLPLNISADAGVGIATSGPLTINGSAGTGGQVLTSAGTGAPPTWTTISSGGTLQDAYDASTSPATITLANGKGLEIVPDTGATAGVSITAADAPLGIYNSGASGFIEISAADAGTSIWGYTAVAIDATNGPVNIGTSVPSATNVNIGTTNKTVKLTGQLQLATTGSTSIEIGTPGGGSTISLDTTSLALNGSEGNSNDVLTSQGPGLPPIWAPAAAGGLTKWTESESNTGVNSSTPVDALTVANAGTNVDAAIVAKGGGATLAQIPDGAASGGDKRGLYATDLQKKRSVSTSVAAAPYSVLLGGENNKIEGLPGWSFQEYSVIVGGKNNSIGAQGTGQDSPYNFVGGGSANSAGGGQYGVVVGGRGNSSRGGSGGGIGGAVVGGDGNSASANLSFIGAGYLNAASRDSAAVVGGRNNTASGNWSTVLGGQGNVANSQGQLSGGHYSYAFADADPDDPISTDPLLTLGNGTGTGASSSNALTLLKDGSLALGLGQSKPSERLHVAGNVRFSGALMPNNSAGTANQVLTSQGPGAAPTWTTISGGGLTHAKLGLAFNQTTNNTVSTVVGGAYFNALNYSGYTVKLEVVGFVAGASDTLEVVLYDVTNAVAAATVTLTSLTTSGTRSAALVLASGDTVYEVQVRNSTSSGNVTLLAANITID